MVVGKKMAKNVEERLAEISLVGMNGEQKKLDQQEH